ncbi:FIST N-terminal domain-containing protein, partial [Candidatus Poribacteria bacterium]
MRAKTIIAVMLIGIAGSIMFSTQCEAAVKIGYGWSINPDETKAVAEAVGMLQKTVEIPDLVFILNESSYDDAVVIKALRELLKDTKIFGYEVSFAVFTQDGIHRGEDGSLALLGFDANNWVIGVGGIGMASMTAVGDIKKAAVQAVEQAIADAGKTRADEPSVVMIAPTKLKEEPILEAIQEVFG